MAPAASRWRRLWWLGLALPLLAGLDRLPATALGQGLNVLDGQIQIAFFQQRGARKAPADPVILAIDAESLELGELLSPSERQNSPIWREMGPWPWPRALQARLAASVLERGAARVLFNIEFSQPSRFGPADDQAFLATLAPWRERVHLAARYGLRDRQGLEVVRLLLPFHPSVLRGSPRCCNLPRGWRRPCRVRTGSTPTWLVSHRPGPDPWPFWRPASRCRPLRWA